MTPEPAPTVVVVHRYDSRPVSRADLALAGEISLGILAFLGLCLLVGHLVDRWGARS